MIPLVSILVPAFDAAPWIGETLASALAQTHPRCEIIVIDDGSRDNTLAVARAIAARHPGRIRVESQANAGASAARNHALRLSRGDFIQYLDADDLLSPRKIELQLARLAAAPAGALATCRWGRFETDPAAARFVDDAVYRDFFPLAWLLLHVGAGAMMHPAAWLLPRSLADRVGPWDESLSLNDDGEYFARVVLASACLASVASPDCTTYYRSGLADSLSRRRSLRALASLRRSVELTDSHLATFAASTGAHAATVRAARADYWQRLAYELYPDNPAGTRDALRRARALGGSRLPAPMGGRLRLAARLLGWRAAYRLARLF